MRAKINSCADQGFVSRSSNYAKHVFTLMHNHFIDECADCSKNKNKGDKGEIIVPTLADKFSRNAQMQRNHEWRME
jgi:hypothetical protein